MTTKLKLQNYRVITACIIAALHPNEPAQAGQIYTPEDEADCIEADSLAHVGYVKKTDEQATVKTWAERQAEKDAEPLVTLEDTGTVPNSVPPVQTAGTINVGEQATGTDPDATTSTATVEPLSDEQVAAFLGNKADEVVATLQQAGTYAHAQQLIDAENARDKPRKTVLDALNAALPSKE